MRLPCRQFLLFIRLQSLQLLGSRQYQTNHSASEGLRILFCGSDLFSAASLKRLYHESLENPQLISSIDVLTKPSKWTGRGYKTLTRVLIGDVATDLGLPTHELPEGDFNAWTTPWRDPTRINLVIAVSFGLKIPYSLLTCARWGGLNLHPSRLPDLRGAAPLHHTLLQGRKHVGITLQTLDPYKFDHGDILDQTPHPGIDLPNDGVLTVPQLVDYVAPLAADMLISGLRQRLFIPELRQNIKIIQPEKGTMAPKISKEDAHIDWNTWPAAQIIRTERVLGRLWNNFSFKKAKNRKSQNSRILFEGITDVTDAFYGSNIPPPLPKPGTMIARPDGDQLHLDIWTCDGRVVNIKTVGMSGESAREGAKGLPRSLDRGRCLADGTKALTYLH